MVSYERNQVLLIRMEKKSYSNVIENICRNEG